MALDFQTLIDRITHAVDQRAYFVPTSHISGPQRAVFADFERRISRADFDPEETRAFLHQEHAAGNIDKVKMLSALHVIACHPSVADWEEAARLVGEQEFAALELGGADLEANLASVDRHRGVLAFLRRHYEVALDYFARALERQRSPENFTNVLAVLVRLGEEDEAGTLLRQARRTFPPDFVVEIDKTIKTDPDLALLRSEDAR